MIFSEITASDVILKLRLNAEELTQAELEDITNILEEARKFVISYTGLTVSECDEFEDICAAVFVLCQDIYDNRGFYVDKSYVNQVVQHILDMHSKNYI
jgi:hypothetical protein